MKKLELYQCEICGTQYNDKRKAVDCEKSHLVDIKITNMVFKPISMEASGFPIKIEITAANGKKAVYRR